jgi:hypothetical protein
MLVARLMARCSRRPLILVSGAPVTLVGFGRCDGAHSDRGERAGEEPKRGTPIAGGAKRTDKAIEVFGIHNVSPLPERTGAAAGFARSWACRHDAPTRAPPTSYD